jgi:hypothetical protein
VSHQFVVHKDREHDVYIGRKNGRLHFGNPFSHKGSKFNVVLVATRAEAVSRFRSWLNGESDLDVEPERRRWILSQLPTLKGKTLGCFCAPAQCHGDVLAEMANK